MQHLSKSTKKLLKPKSVREQIKERNRLFKNATPAQKRVLIARDVIKQINSLLFIPRNGSFVGLSRFRSFKKDESVQKLFLQGEISNCQCCALGAMVMSTTLFANKVKVEEVDRYFDGVGSCVEFQTPMPNQFNEIFSQEQLVLIEIAFERGNGWFMGGGAYIFDNEKKNRAIAFGEFYENSEDRLIAIMKNIIKNRGTFKP